MLAPRPQFTGTYVPLHGSGTIIAQGCIKNWRKLSFRSRPIIKRSNHDQSSRRLSSPINTMEAGGVRHNIPGGWPPEKFILFEGTPQIRAILLCNYILILSEHSRGQAFILLGTVPQSLGLIRGSFLPTLPT